MQKNFSNNNLVNQINKNLKYFRTTEGFDKNILKRREKLEKSCLMKNNHIIPNPKIHSLKNIHSVKKSSCYWR